MSESASNARADVQLADGVLSVRVSGDWKLTGERVDWHEVVARTMERGDQAMPHTIRVVAEGLVDWDSSLSLFLRHARAGAEAIGAKFETQNLPKAVVELMDLLVKKERVNAESRLPDLFTAVGNFAHFLLRETKDIAGLVGECSFSVMRFVRGQAQFRWRDCLTEMQRCGAQALPIVGLISFLVGVILAYQAAAQLRTFGADIYVADMVGVAVVREMGPLMAAIVLAGRTGAAFAATLGSMKANEEIDAFETLGVSPVDFLVMPRMAALFVMMPLLAIYSDVLGIFGGMLIAQLPPLNIPPRLFFAEMQTIVDLSDLFTGLIKAATYGALIGLSGCLRGMQAERSAAGVGQAATAAVVTSILLIIVSNAIFAVIFNILGW